ncbi:MAG TPA: hypothetical protein PKL63_12015, partial [Dermatophilaceae bacterium]|nr:hypothetical protein [Dermatophilaceae bacterium]
MAMLRGVLRVSPIGDYRTLPALLGVDFLVVDEPGGHGSGPFHPIVEVEDLAALYEMLRTERIVVGVLTPLDDGQRHALTVRDLRGMALLTVTGDLSPTHRLLTGPDVRAHVRLPFDPRTNVLDPCTWVLAEVGRKLTGESVVGIDMQPVDRDRRAVFVQDQRGRRVLVGEVRVMRGSEYLDMDVTLDGGLVTNVVVEVVHDASDA